MNLLICAFWIALGFGGGVLVERQYLKARLVRMVKTEEHWNDDCGWDVPAIAVLDVLERVKREDHK